MIGVSGGGLISRFNHKYDDIISFENLLQAWQEFIKGKHKKEDVAKFSANLTENLGSLHTDLKSKTYKHGRYTAFNISDPKPRNIHKASVCDRVVHHLLYKALYLYFDQKFIHDSYSCRARKGTHRAIKRFEVFGRKVSKNYTKQCFVLKCDIRKFFASIDHQILKEILARHIEEPDILNLLGNIIDSFNSTPEVRPRGIGLPLGNLTSQLLVNIYMNEFDQFVKHSLKEKYYIRYADDFVFLNQDKLHLENLILRIYKFLETKLKLTLHPNKVFIKTLYSGVDFLGWVQFSKHRVLRTSTKRKMLRNLKEDNMDSYKGLLKHGNTYTLMKKLDLLQ